MPCAHCKALLQSFTKFLSPLLCLASPAGELVQGMMRALAKRWAWGEREPESRAMPAPRPLPAPAGRLQAKRRAERSLLSTMDSAQP